MAVFLWIETRTSQPITPLHLFADRNRAGSYAIMLALAVAPVVVRARAPEAEAERVVAGSQRLRPVWGRPRRCKP
jgi:hypothetical protein